MGTLDYRDAIRKAFHEDFVTQELEEDRVAYPNYEFEIPSPDPDEENLWVRFQILEADRNQISVSRVTRNSRVLGDVLVSVFIPHGIGERLAEEKIEVLVPLFERLTIEGVVFRTPVVTTVGRDGDWFQTNVNCPFQYDELAS